MEPRRVGAVFRAIRISKRWRQDDVAQRAGVSRSAISRLESGALTGMTVGALMGVADALGVGVDIVPRWRGGDLDRLLNARHSALHEAVARDFAARAGWVASPEVSFSIYGERGVIDVLAWHAATRMVLVVELKTEIVDIQELIGRLDTNRRLAGKVARERGWSSAAVACWVIVGDSKTNRRRVQAHAALLRAVFPVDGRGAKAWLDRPERPMAALSFWPNSHPSGAKSGLATAKRVRRQDTGGR